MLDHLLHRLIPLLLAVLAVFAPIQSILNAVIFCVLADLVFGVWAAKKRGERIRSAGLRKTVAKLVVYLAAVCLCYIAERYLLYSALPVVKIVAGLVAVTEIKSVLENLDVCLGGNLFASLIARLAPPNEKS